MKSHVSTLTKLAIELYKDAVAKCTDVTLDVRDIDTLMSRVEDEGLSFLTITLPTFGKDFDMSLAAGRIEPSSFRSFRKFEKAPAFLRGFFALIFDKNGRIYAEPSIAALEGIRQMAYAFKKLQVPCSPIRVARAIAKFRTSELCFEVPVLPDDLAYFCQVSRAIWSGVLSEGNIPLSCAIPKHGPGATAEKLAGNGKFKLSNWHDRLEPYFPVLDNAFANADARFSAEFEKVTIIAEDDEQPVRVIAVPKTLKTPRIIAIEPVCMQYAQQAISKLIVRGLETHEYTSGHVNFTDQTINRELAMTSSRDKRLATLDLSSASDLVPYELAISMFDSHPDLRDAIAACRSKRAQLPSGDIISLKKFASMGSALCFPVEAMYFYTICVAALLRERNLPLSESNILNVGKDIFVYGDDILVPTDESVAVIRSLHKYFCKVNVRKSFSEGNFRESCGMDAYDGEDVTPTYIRQLCPDNRRKTSALISWLATSNLLYKRGYWKASSHMLKHVETILGTLPVVGDDCAGLGKFTFQKREHHWQQCRWNPGIQVHEVRTWVASSKKFDDVLDGNLALVKCLTMLELRKPSRGVHVRSIGEGEVSVLRHMRKDVAFPALLREDDWDHTQRDGGLQAPLSLDENHLTMTALHDAVALKRRWVRPY